MTALDGVPESPGRIDEGASTMTDATRVPQHTYDIRAQDGTLEALHVRKDPPLGRKHVSWQLPNGTKGLGGRAAKTLPLYRSETLKALPPGSMVFVCEGEKATERDHVSGISPTQLVDVVAAPSGGPTFAPQRHRPFLTQAPTIPEGELHARQSRKPPNV